MGGGKRDGGGAGAAVVRPDSSVGKGCTRPRAAGAAGAVLSIFYVLL